MVVDSIGSVVSSAKYWRYGKVCTRGINQGMSCHSMDSLLKRTNADASWTLYIGGVYEKTFDAAGAVTKTTKYYTILGRTVAVSNDLGGGGLVSYLLQDHLGSTVGALNGAGGVIPGSQMKYWPYGATRSGGDPRTDKLYTGQQQEAGDPAMGLYNYKARFYSTTTGRFVSADTLAVGDLNRYTYVRNNPLRYDDPSGHCPENQCLPTPAKTPGPNDASNSACAANPFGCLLWSLALEGAPLPKIGLAAVMGVRQGYQSWKEYAAFIQEFWDETFSSCAGEAAVACFNGFAALMERGGGGAIEAFARYGVFIIPTTQEGIVGLFTGVAGALIGRLPGYGDLDWFMTQGAIRAGGVIGFSNGAAVVSQWFADHTESTVRFALIEPFSFTVSTRIPIAWRASLTVSVTLVDLRVVESQISRAAWYFTAFSCAGGGHCEHDDAAADVIGALFP